MTENASGFTARSFDLLDGSAHDNGEERFDAHRSDFEERICVGGGTHRPKAKDLALAAFHTFIEDARD
ncbi:hypothetical protein [Ilumatobacter sp.]|uniref:hypothetical protein n=1 Tax=Ilumatobacter sp. TaxID=1967498 RepID=UPI003B51CBF5